MKLCPSEADFRPVSGRVHHVSDHFLIGIEGCRYKDQASLFPTHHDDSGWCGCSSNHGVYCGYYGQYGDCLSHTASMLWGDWRVCTFELPWLFFGKEIAFSKTYPSFLTLKEGSTFLTKPLFPQGRENVAGSAIAPPEFWSASGACAHKGLAGSAYATELRLFVGWRIVEFADSLQIFGFFLGGFNKKAYFCGKV